ncbi:hypothetical protein D9619_013293 [Psilocybe cf. subviscida]|uniref:F-box domain-containing protein n=1 Tax=Psilocybe cf. subviscida TaxID=2480587 RepID=A0A8H5BS95_9AGAR|nr:hypothetical protein D9619_013293 [Psilocybe cf. subviscida]
MIWREVNNLHALFSIMAPMASNQEYFNVVYNFVEVPSATGWRRFETYAMLVHTLVYTPTGGSGGRGHISRAALRDIAQTRTPLDVFPNLHTLKWHSPRLSSEVNEEDIPIPSDAALFMHAGIRSLEFSLHELLPLSQRRDFLDDIPQRTPFLTKIDLRTTSNTSVIDLEDNIRALAHHLPSLQLVCLPKGYLTRRIAEVLSTSPALHELQLGMNWDEDYDEPRENFVPVLPAGRFPALNKLTVAVSFADAACLINTVTPKNGLDEIFLTSQNPSREDMERVLQICANKHKRIQRLNIQCKDDEQHPPFTFQTLCSLKKLSSLTALEISHRSPIVMSPAEFISTISSIPQLTRLCFNQAPLYCETASLGLAVLPVIARSCKHLTELKLFLDATLPLPDEESYDREDFFVKLKYLSLGVSVITQKACQPVAMFLATHLPFGCTLLYGGDWIVNMKIAVRHGELFGIARKRIELWCHVKSLVQFSERIRIQERRWASAS